MNFILESAPKRQFNGKPDTERSRSVLIPDKNDPDNFYVVKSLF